MYTPEELDQAIATFVECAPLKADQYLRAYALRAALRADPTGAEIRRVIAKALEANREQRAEEERGGGA